MLYSSGGLSPCPSFETGDSGRKGFTLVELLVVIFVISLVAALAMPSFSVIGEKRIKSDARKVSAIVRFLAESAVARKQTYALKIDFAERSIHYEGPDGQRSVIIKDITSVDMQTKGLISEGDLTVFFGPMGASEAFSIYLGDSEDTFTIAFNPLSGRVKILNNSE